MQKNNTAQVKKTKSKTTLLHKFMGKFTKKKKRSKGSSSTQTSRERSSEHSKGKRVTRSQSKSKLPGQAGKYDACEVTAKGMKSKEGKGERDKKKKKEDQGPSKSPSMIMIAMKESQMDVGMQSQKIEKSMKTWLETLEKSEYKVILETDFTRIDGIQTDPEKCKVFQKNMDLCQSENSAVLDENRVKAGDGEFFYHGSVINLPNMPTKVILAQLPLSDDPICMEAFWLMVAANKMQRVFVLCGPDEIEKKTMSDYFPDDFVKHKTISVNNKKTLPRGEDQTNDMMYFEVVPTDCAEAPFAMMEICDFWPDEKIPTNPNRPASTAGSVFDSDIDPDASIGVVSMFGAGRAGSFLVAALAIDKLRSGEAPVIKDLAQSVRDQRPGAIETLSQYTYIHVIALTYCLKFVSNPTMKSKMEKVISQLEQFAFEQMIKDEEDDSAPNNTTEN